VKQTASTKIYVQFFMPVQAIYSGLSGGYYLLLCPVVSLYVPMNSANFGIFVSLRTKTERNLMKFAGGNHCHQQMN